MEQGAWGQKDQGAGSKEIRISDLAIGHHSNTLMLHASMQAGPQKYPTSRFTGLFFGLLNRVIIPNRKNKMKDEMKMFLQM